MLSRIKSIKNWIRNCFIKSKRYIKYKKSIFKRKYYTKFNSFLKISCFFIYLFLFVFLLSFILIQIGTLDLSTFSFNIEHLDIREQRFEYLWTQISISFISTTVISMLAIFSSSYLYGKKYINVIFNKYSLLSIQNTFICLFLLIIGSIICCFNEEYHFIIFINFILTIFIIFYILLRIILFYTWPDLYKYTIKSEYIREDKKYTSKCKFIPTKNNTKLIELKNVTMTFIKSNTTSYNENINAILNMLEISFFNNQKSINKYYTYYSSARNDLITILLEIIIFLCDENKYNEAINLFAILDDRLSYYRIVLAKSNQRNLAITKLTNRLKYMTNDYEIIQTIKALYNVSYNEIRSMYLFHCELDLSDIIKNIQTPVYLPIPNLLEEIYTNIYDNNYLSHKQKEIIYKEFYDNFRLMEFHEKYPPTDIIQFYPKKIINNNPIEIPIIYKAEPIILMIFDMIENNDIANIKYSLTINFSKKTIAFIILIICISLLDFVYIKSCKKVYLLDWNLNRTQIKDIFLKTRLLNYNIESDILNELYINIKDNYENRLNKTGAYFFNPKLDFSQLIIDNVFYYFYNATDKNNKISYDEKVQDLLKKYKSTQRNQKK